MPWTKADVNSHMKGLSDHQKDVWVAAANNALRQCEKEGGKDCDGRAIRIANAAAKRIKESYVSPSLVFNSLPQNSSTTDLLEALSMLAQDESFDARTGQVSDAVQRWAQLHALTNASDGDMYGSYSYAYVVDLYSDVVIFRWRNQLWQAGYSIDSENKASLDDPTRVKLYYAPLNSSGATTTDVPESFREAEDAARLFAMPTEFSNPDSDPDLATDSEETTLESIHAQEEMLIESECVPLTEAAVNNGKAKVCVITPGWGSYGYYSEDVLKRDGPGAFSKGTHMHWDHPTIDEMKSRPEGSLDKLAGVLESDAQWSDDGFNGPGLYADVKVLEGKSGVLNEIAPHIGVSIKAPGMVKEGEAEGRKGRIVESLISRKTNAVDFVTIPGRGGKVCELVEAAREHIEQIEKSVINTESSGDIEVDKEALEAQIKEAVTAAVAEATKDSTKTITELQARVERQNDALRLRDAREAATVEVAKYKNLGDRAKNRVVALAVAGEVPLTEAGALDIDAIKTRVKENADAEAEYLKAELGHNNANNGRAVVRGLGESDIESDDSAPAPEKIREALIEAGKALGYSDDDAKIFAETSA